MSNSKYIYDYLNNEFPIKRSHTYTGTDFVEKHLKLIPLANMFKRLMKTYEKANSAIKLWDYFVEDNHYFGDHTKYLSCGVKVYSSGNLEKLIEKYPKRKRELIEEKFKDEYTWDIWSNWIEDSREDLIQCITDKSFLGNEEYNKHIGILNLEFKDIMFYGNNGGHLCIEIPSNPLEDDINVLENLSTELEEDYHANYFDTSIKDINNVIKEMKDKIKAFEWLFKFAEDYVKKLDFQEELKYRVEDFIGEMEQEKLEKKKQKELIRENQKFIDNEIKKFPIEESYSREDVLLCE